MTQPTFLEGAAVALGCAVIGQSLATALPPLLPLALAVRAVITVSGLVYLVYLITRGAQRHGKASASLVCGALLLAAWWMSTSLIGFALLHLGAIWSARSLCFRSRLLGVAADWVLCLLGALAALLAWLHSASPFLAFWSFFLTQALFTCLPAVCSRARSTTAESPQAFSLAHRNAQAALQRFLSNP